MAHSFNRLHTRCTPEQAFDFISDFRHAPLWDPRTQSVRKLSDGPVGRDSRFMLTALLGFGVTLEFPYTIEVYERARELVFAGSRPCFKYRERVTFAADATGTTIEWHAEMQLTSLLFLGNPVLSLVYQRIGDDATSGIAPAVESATAQRV